MPGLIEESPPAVEVISLSEAMLHLRIDDTASPPSHPDIPLIQSIIAAARAHIDGRDGWLGRALVSQQWRLLLDGFPDCGGRGGGGITIPLPPLQFVESISYIDPAGVEQQLGPDDYEYDYGSLPARIIPVYGTIWPATRRQTNAVSIIFTAGYGDAGEHVPQPIRQALLLLIGHFYEHREAVSPAGLATMPMAVDTLLAPYRVF